VRCGAASTYGKRVIFGRLLTGGNAVADTASACDLGDPRFTEGYPFDVLVGKAAVAREYGLSLNLYCPCSLKLFESYL
jgi:hypothetical protein